MASIDSLQEKYEDLGRRFESRPEPGIDSSLLLAFDYDYQENDAEVVIDTQEFTAVCPWTDLPDFGTLTIAYAPDRSCIELKSLKYYLSSFAGIGIVQEHAANRILTGPRRLLPADANEGGPGLQRPRRPPHHRHRTPRKGVARGFGPFKCRPG